MANKAQISRRAENEAFAKARHIRGSERKLNLLAQMIRGKSAARALVDLQFSRKRMALDVKKVLEAAIANAENNHNLDVDRLFVKEATVGRTMTMKRFRPRAKGRAGSIKKPFSNITIILQEADDSVAKKSETKKPVVKKTTEAKKSAAKKTETKTEAKKPAAKKPAAKKAETKKPAAKKPAATKAKKTETKKKAGE